jgi:Predicted glycosyltransferases
VDVAIICVTHNSIELIADFLRAALDDCAGGSQRIVVVDSASTDGTPEAARAVSTVVDVCVMAGNYGYAAGINVGIDHVRGTGGAGAFVVANPDVLLGPGNVALLVDALALEDVGVSCPMIMDQYGVRDDSLNRLPNVWTGLVGAVLGGRGTAVLGLPVEVVRDTSAYERAHAVGWACGGLLAISEECLTRVGLWNEEYFMYEEEVDFCQRVAQAGLRVWYVPDAVVTRAVFSDANAPWRHALSQINRIRREDHSGGGSLRRTQFVLENLLRLWRPRSRAALWAVITNATPGQVIHRYRPGSQIEVGAATPSAPAPYAVLSASGNTAAG